MTQLYARRNVDDRFRVISRFDGVTISKVGPDGADIDVPWTVPADHFAGLYRPIPHDQTAALTAERDRAQLACEQIASRLKD